MFRRIHCLLFVLVLILAASSVFGWELFSYMGDVSPAAPGSCGTFYGNTFTWVPWTPPGASASNVVMGQVVDDPGAQDGKAWYINDNNSAAYEAWRLKPTGALNCDTTDGATVIARIKKISESDQGATFGILHSGYYAMCYWGGPNGLIKETVRPGDPKAVLGDNQYHTIRITAQGEGSGWVVPHSCSFESPYAPGNLSGQQGWGGDNSEKVQVTQQAPASATNQAVMISGENVTDLNVDVNVRAAGINGIITITAKVHAGVYPDGDPGTLWYFRALGKNGEDMSLWYGRAEFARPRQLTYGVLNGVQLDAPVGWYTLEQQIDVINNQASFFITPPGGSRTALGSLPIPATADQLDRLRLTASYQTPASAGAGETFYIDDITVNGTPLPYRTIKMYIDEQTDDAHTLVNDNAIWQDAGRDGFAMGALSEAGMQEVYIDWICGTTAGAFAPGEEETIIGQSLMPNPATSIASAKLAPENTPVILTRAIVTAPLPGYDAFDGLVTSGFGIEETDRSSGIRVIWKTASPFFPGTRVNIRGSIGTDEGERVIIAYDVQDANDPLPPEEAIKPMAVGNKSSVGGAFGSQDAAADDATTPSTSSPSFMDTFSYPNSPLYYSNIWDVLSFGVATRAMSEMVVENGALKISAAGLPLVDLGRTVNCTDMGTGTITVKAKIKTGSGASNFWNIYIDDPAGNNLARFYGSGSTARGRIGGTSSVTNTKTLVGAQNGWDVIEAQIVKNPFGDGGGVYFYFNGELMNMTPDLMPYTEGATHTVGRLLFVRDQNIDLPADYVYFDDLAVFPGVSKSAGTNNVGLYTTIYGKVTAVDSTSSMYDRSFYVDDGSGIKDGSGNIGIKCRPPYDYNFLPTVGDYVAVTGIMGVKQVNGVNARFFWTWTWNSYSP